MSKFDKLRLNKNNIINYILEKYDDFDEAVSVLKNTLEIEPFLQRRYGEFGDGDCFLTSVMTCIRYYSKNKLSDEEIYPVVRKIAKDHFFSSKVGTNPIMMKSIFDKSLAQFNFKTKTSSGYLKNIGFNLATIKNNIRKQKPVIFSMFNDGRNYYKSHSITVVGFETFKLLNNKTKKTKLINMLVVYDN